MVIHPWAKYGLPMSKQTKVIGRTQNNMSKLDKFHLELKGQRRIRIINIRDTSSQSQTKKVVGRTQICTDNRTDRQIDKGFLHTPRSSFMGDINICVHTPLNVT